MSRVWHVRSGTVDEVVRADDQFQAWDTLRDRPVEHFGLIVAAEPDEDELDTVYVRTSALLFSWGRDDEALAAIATGIAHGLPDTEDLDRRFRP